MRFLALILCMLSLTGCLTHWFVDGETRLQLSNVTENYTLLELSVISEDSTETLSWISETLKPGERSHVVSGDWIGKFTVQLKYVSSESEDFDESSVQQDVRELEFEGGSLFLQVSESGDSLVYKFR